MGNGRRGDTPKWLAAMLLSASLIGIAGCAERAQDAAPAKAADVAPQLIQNERDSWRKYAARDLEGSRPLLAADYADVQTDGTLLDREGHLAFVPKANVEWHELDRFNVFLLSPDAAVVTYRARSRDRGVQETYQADVTAGWSLRNGQWVATFYRETPTPPETPAAAE
ncbi:uncharacterized protein DUF4440 [Panacagrimonas perspica]|uniref:Uncharacterized protein DUF4440 n=1 Tax=Panacagrimonas perspica TaxID=381431 RepID=A0A4R7NZ36_9GAMM|nr:nuclear transport factor 2 family protein [Panacagrimonas perspica]TDU25820.1 uncharacterized protein DUF4440 [Panacagrimonas perspica]THD02811.1 hypothetical protein B1810_12895 [Panacagrimonas perspica]